MGKIVKRSRIVGIRFTSEEFDKINKAFEKTVYKDLSEYLRVKLLDKPIVVKYRNESLDNFMEELILLRQEINAIGNNYNQAVKKLHALSQVPEFRTWIQANEKLRTQLTGALDSLQLFIDKISVEWLQE